MGLFTAGETGAVEAISRLVYCNPFLPERIEHERAALGDEFDDRDARWNVQTGAMRKPRNVVNLVDRAEQLLDAVSSRAAGSAEPIIDGEIALFEDVLLFVSFDRLGFGEIHNGPLADSPAILFDKFQSRVRRHQQLGPNRLPLADQMPHALACFYQLHRAFQNTFHFIIGFSRAAIQLRAAVWQSIFTHDMRRYRRTLFTRMADFTTLVTGPSGTGKELVAQAIGLSRYVQFDPKSRTFAGESADMFFPLNLSALSLRSSNRNCSVTSAARSPAPASIVPVGSKFARRAEPCFSTRSAISIRESR